MQVNNFGKVSNQVNTGVVPTNLTGVGDDTEYDVEQVTDEQPQVTDGK